MATPTLVHSSPRPSIPPPNSVKELSDSGSLSTLPSLYASQISDATDAVEEAIPTIDLHQLTNGTPDQRSRTVLDLERACMEWGFFMVVNHGVPERVRAAMLDMSQGFFDLTVEEKQQYMGKHVMDPIRCGTSFNSAVEDVRYWRDYFKVFVHPEFHSPEKPPGFREIAREYSWYTRALAMELLNGIWESLGLEKDYMNRALNLHSCFQVLVGNLYPPCPQPELAAGLPPHSDHGLLTILYQNGVDGLQVKHGDNWVHVRPLPNSFLVNTGDHIEIISNGRYRSVLHQARVNNRDTRISIPTVIGPSLDTVVEPAAELVSSGSPMAYRGMRYGEFLEYQQGNQLKEKSVLDLLRNNN